ncbi:CHASE2 domain-containing protein [Methylobrevis albus]|uniref:Adenylate/guanylate cyclase domain-containing protein n=1 Tax=Methylobrevis albus TaxID=2793297 RepID=A0A931MXU8_9HYPH|nr:adenylate/guanylate cyclase domain-containing protein [Methylobrevis albus]MBH0239648.1 adenylate/guanylate cyclase domain-containing protein [Methylobrevis albus]
MTAAALPPVARRRAVLAGLAGALIAAVLLAADPGGLARTARDRTLDVVALISAAPGDVTVVEIDADSLAALGPWPWPRAMTARLIAAIAADRPALIAVDILFAVPGADDAALVAAVGSAPVVLASLFSGRPDGPPPRHPAAVVVRERDPRLAPWREAGLVEPDPAIAAAAGAIGLAALAADPDGIVRHAPLLARAGDTVVAGLAAEAVRVARGASAFIVDGEVLHIADLAVPLPPAADLRIRPAPATLWPQRTLSAAAVLGGDVPAGRFAGRIVLLGGGAAALGALRPSAAGPVTPQVQIAADAVETILAGTAPRRPAAALWAEPLVGLLAALPAVTAALSFGTAATAAVALGLAATLAGAALAAFLAAALVFDPLGPGLVVLAGAGAAMAMLGLEARRAAARIRRRFEQHLAPEVVARIVARPDLVKLGGERRMVTALFTDIEGFTALAERLPAEELVALLDAYFGRVTAIVTAHGGMVDKIVGDAVHALFNVPLDLAEHADRAVAAGLAIQAATEAFRAEPSVRDLALGRTRIGIESGIAVVGDVGAGDKLDYTAHGSAVNTAARLEALGKTLGTGIIVGPACRALCPARRFRSLGSVDVRGRGPLELFSPEG